MLAINSSKRFGVEEKCSALDEEAVRGIVRRGQQFPQTHR